MILSKETKEEITDRVTGWKKGTIKTDCAFECLAIIYNEAYEESVHTQMQERTTFLEIIDRIVSTLQLRQSNDGGDSSDGDKRSFTSIEDWKIVSLIIAFFCSSKIYFKIMMEVIQRKISEFYQSSWDWETLNQSSWDWETLKRLLKKPPLVKLDCQPIIHSDASKDIQAKADRSHAAVSSNMGPQKAASAEDVPFQFKQCKKVTSAAQKKEMIDTREDCDIGRTIDPQRSLRRYWPLWLSHSSRRRDGALAPLLSHEEPSQALIVSTQNPLITEPRAINR